MAIASTTKIPTLQRELAEDEGCKRIPYKDTKGIWTCGIGCNLEAKGWSEVDIQHLIKLGGWSDLAIETHFKADLSEATNLLDKHISWWRKLPGDPTPEGTSVRARALLNMVFNMGWGDGSNGLGSFKNTLELIRTGHFEKASLNILASKYARDTGYRAHRQALRIATGVYYPKDAK